jgi:hypothetical protein
MQPTIGRRRETTNEEILAKWLQRRGRITLSTAMELERLEKRFAHLAKAK